MLAVSSNSYMEQKQLLAIAVVAILVVAAVGAYVVVSDDDEDYRSTNTDCRLKILGNADENDYIDERDVEKINDMITKDEYSQMADANDDGKVDKKDAELVQKIIDIRAKNQGKDFDQKDRIDIKFIDVDKQVQNAKYPVGDFIIINSQRALEVAIALGIEERVLGLCLEDLKSYWDTNEYAGCDHIVNVGKKNEPDLEAIAKIDADTIVAGQRSIFLKNVDGDHAGNKQILRLPTWENAGQESAALTFGFIMDTEKTAEKYVKWMDDLNAEVQKEVAKLSDDGKTSFLLVASPTSMSVQKDGVSSALDKTGSKNIGNVLVTNPGTSYGKTTEHKEDIIKMDPEYVFFSFYIMSQNTTDDLQKKFDNKKSDWQEIFGATSAYKDKKIVAFDYGLPFCLVTLIGCHIMYEDMFSEEFVMEKVQEYIDEFTNAPDGFEADYDRIVYHPLK